MFSSDIYADGYYNDWIVKITPGLYNVKGQKILVPSSVRWNKEYKSIIKSYPQFADYVKDANVFATWYMNVSSPNELY